MIPRSPDNNSSNASSLVVGFRNRDTCLAALRWAIRVAKEGSLNLRVVHASSGTIAVRNGPSSAIAHQLGSPQWATVHTLVEGLDAPAGTETIIKPGNPETVLQSYIEPGDIVVLGERGRWPSRDLKKKLESKTSSTVIRISDGDPNDTSDLLLPSSLIGAEQ